MSQIRAASAYVELGLRQSAFTKGLKSAERSLARTGSKLRGIGQGILAAGGTLAAGFAIPTKIFADFDDRIRQVKAVTGATGKQFEMLTETAKRLGRTTSFTAGEVAGLMVELGRAGFDPSQINKMTDSVLSLSKATGTDATESSGILAATIRQFNLGAEDASRVADTLTVAANNSFNSVTSLGEALKFAGPVAADFGVELEDTLAILGGLGNVGIQGTLAGSALRRLLTLTGADAENLEKIFGVAFKDAAGNARPLAKVLAEVNEKTKGLGSAERAKKFNDAFGLLGISAASAIGKSAESIGDLTDKLGNAEGVAARTAAEMEAGIGGAFRKLTSAAEGIAIAIGEAVDGPLSQFSEWLTTAAGEVTKFVQAHQGLVKGLLIGTGVLLGAGAALIAIGSAFGFASFAIGGIISAMGFLATIVGVAGSAIALIGSILAAVVSPIGLVVTGIAVLITAFLTMTDAGQKVVQWFSSNFTKIFSVVSEAMGGIFEAISSGQLGLAAEIGFTGVKLAIGIILEEIESLFGVSFASMFSVIAQFGKSIATVLAQLNVARAKVTGFLAEQISLSDQVVKFISGVDPAIERERSRKSNELAAKLGAAQQDITVSGTLKDDNARAIKDAEDLAASVGKFDPSQFGKDLRKSFNPDDLKAKLEDLRRTARTKVENPITEGVGKAVEAVKAVAFEGFGDVISEGQSKFKSQGSFVGAAAGQQGSSTASKMFDLQKQQLAFEKKKEEKQKQRDDKLHAAVVKNSNIKPVRV